MDGVRFYENVPKVIRSSSGRQRKSVGSRGGQDNGARGESLTTTSGRDPGRERQTMDQAARRARGLGWFSVGLGVTQLLAPRALARAIGLGHGQGECLAMRAVGLRELVAGMGILSGRKPSAWLWSRVAGDLMDLALLGQAMRSQRDTRGRHRGRIPGALLAVAGVTALDVLTSRQLSQGKSRGLSVQLAPPVRVSGFITINKSPAEVYSFWRDFQNLSRFMTNVESVQVLDSLRSRWTVKVATKTVKWDAEITEDRVNEVIAWQTLKNADVANSGEVRFLRAPGERGTEVRVNIEVRPPGGVVGRAVAKLGHIVPEQQLENDLRRLKQVLELGEVVHSDASIHRGPHPARPAQSSVRRAWPLREE